MLCSKVERSEVLENSVVFESDAQGSLVAMRVLARKLAWVASAQPDYPNPCVKMLTNWVPGVTARGHPRFQKSLPRRLRPHWAQQEREGEPHRVVPGLCGEAFLEVLDAILTPLGLSII